MRVTVVCMNKRGVLGSESMRANRAVTKKYFSNRNVIAVPSRRGAVGASTESNHVLFNFKGDGMNLLRKLGLLIAFSIVTLGGPQAALADETAKGKVIVTGTFGPQPTGVNFSLLTIDDAPSHVIIQQVRIDPLLSQDPRWNNLTAKIQEQLDAYGTQGTFRIYVEFSDPSQPARGKAYGFYAGSFLVNLNGSASFSAKGDFLGGTGDFAGVQGKISVDGTITDIGRYTITLILTK